MVIFSETEKLNIQLMQLQLEPVFGVGVEVVYRLLETTEVMMTRRFHVIIKPSSPVTSLTAVMKCVGTSHHGEWMFVEMEATISFLMVFHTL